MAQRVRITLTSKDGATREATMKIVGDDAVIECDGRTLCVKAPTMLDTREQHERFARKVIARITGGDLV